VYFKLSSIILEQQAAAHLSGADFVRHAVDVYGAQRILWGSDVGNTQAPYAELVQLALDSAARLTPREQRQVFHDTGKAVHARGGRGGGRPSRAAVTP
jgi:L-fuconolactonase